MMQTFLPYSDPSKVAHVLDRQRLGKQRVEAKQILDILLQRTQKAGWKNHPAILMWKGYEFSLVHYGYHMCLEWIHRGYRDNLSVYFWTTMYTLTKGTEFESDPDTLLHNYTPGFITEELIQSHRSNLIAKDISHYAHLWPETPWDLNYVWPRQPYESLQSV